MKKLTTILIISLISTICYSQDSVKLKIVRIGTMDNKTVYWLKDIKTKDRYVTICECKRKKGEIVSIAKKDLIIIKDFFTKKDLE